MTIESKLEGTALTVSVAGRLDTVTAPKLDAELSEKLAGITSLTFDFAGLEYLSSAGLRVLLSAQKRMKTQGKMLLTNVNAEVNEVFEITGFSEFLTIV